MAAKASGEARTQRSGAGPWVALAVTCLALAVLDRTLVRDAMLELDPELRETVTAEVASRLVELPGGEARARRLRLRRTDEVLVATGDAAVVQATLAWVDPETRDTLSQTTGLYGVSRRERVHLSGYGDRERHGVYAFPPDPTRGDLTLWDPFHPGPLVLSFESVERREDVELWRYRLVGRSEEVDASAAYGQLPLVPERYRVMAQVELDSLLVEPRTGRVVDREQQGRARFVLASDGTPLGDAHVWYWRFAPEDRTRLLAESRRVLRLVWVVERLVPGLLLALAALATVVAVLRLRRKRRVAG